MMSNSRDQLRQLFFDVWQKENDRQQLSELEQQIKQVIVEHPEYHYIFEDRETYLDKDFSVQLGETNPFLHMSLHLTVRDQIKIDQPVGMRRIYQKLVMKLKAPQEVEHHIIGILADEVWLMQNQQRDLGVYACQRR